MKIATRGLNVLKDFEKCVLTAYQDSKGIWTIGWGHTGPDVHEGLVWTQACADHMLEVDLATAERCVNTSVRLKLSQGQFDALVLLVYNIGIGAFATSTLRRFLNLADTVGAGKQFARWNKETLPDGTVRVNEGLRRRRAAELELFNSSEY